MSIPYKHPVRPVSSRPTAQIVIISASGAGALDFNLHMSLSRKYYAHRHGYGYQHLVSNAYANYFGDNFLDVSTETYLALPCPVLLCLALFYL